MGQLLIAVIGFYGTVGVLIVALCYIERGSL